MTIPDRQIDAALVERLRLWVQDPQHTTTMTQMIIGYPVTIRPPATLKQVEACEARIGFRLPWLIREIYLRIGNGGFGPGYGIIGVDGGFEVYGETLAENVRNNREAEDTFAELGWDEPDWHWKEQYIPYGYWGDNVMTVVDCAEETLTIFAQDATVLKPHTSQNLRQWWLDWLEGRISQQY